MTPDSGPISDLAVPNGGDAAQLDEARAAVYAALAGGQRQAIHAGIGGGTLAGAVAAAPAPTPAPAELAGEAAAAAPLVLRRDLPLQPLTGPGALPAWAVGRAATTIGPLVGALGQPVHIDIFPPIEGSSLRRAAQRSPLVRVAGTTLRWGPDGSGRIGQGSVWLPARQFDATVTPASWVGLTVSGGTITGARATVGPDGTLIVPDDATLTIELDLLAPAAPAGHGPGEDARAADVRLPGQATFVLAPVGGHVGAVAHALLTVYGETVRFEGLVGNAHLASTLGSLFVPLKAAPAGWHAAHHESTLVTLAGGGGIEAAGWALPVTVADPSTLGAAAGTGQLALRIPGLTLAVVGQQPLPLGTGWLTAQPGQLTVASDDAIGTGATGQVTLYPDPRGGTSVGGRAGYRYADSFAIRYLSSSAGAETVFTHADLDVSLDRPVTGAGGRIPLQSGNGVLAFNQQDAATTMLLEGAGDAILKQSLVMALENALLETGAPLVFLLRAAVTRRSPQLEALAGKAAILLPLRGALPTLPDPYAATITPTPCRDIASATFAAAREVAAARQAGRLLVARVDWDATAGPSTPSLAFSQPGAGTARLDWVAPTPARAQDFMVAAQGTAAKDQQLLAELSELDQRYTGSTPGPIALLDVSTAADQFGVRYGVANADRQTGRIEAADVSAVTPAVSGPIIDGLSVVAPANTVRVITLPAVQWEPISGPDASGPFSPMAFPNSGGETRVTSRSVHLVPVAPNPAIRQLVTDFTRHVAAPPPVVFSITFPFGICAVALLRHPTHPMALDHMGAMLDLHEPHFGVAGVAGSSALGRSAVPACSRGVARPSPVRPHS